MNNPKFKPEERAACGQPLSDLLYVLDRAGYKNYGKQSSYNGELWQRKHESGCFFNFYIYRQDNVFHVDMVTAEICFECSNMGQWCNHQLYGLSVANMANMVAKTEEKLFEIFIKYEGGKYI